MKDSWVGAKEIRELFSRKKLAEILTAAIRGKIQKRGNRRLYEYLIPKEILTDWCSTAYHSDKIKRRFGEYPKEPCYDQSSKTTEKATEEPTCSITGTEIKNIFGQKRLKSAQKLMRNGKIQHHTTSEGIAYLVTKQTLEDWTKGTFSSRRLANWLKDKVTKDSFKEPKPAAEISYETIKLPSEKPVASNDGSRYKCELVILRKSETLEKTIVSELQQKPSCDKILLEDGCGFYTRDIQTNERELLDTYFSATKAYTSRLIVLLGDKTSLKEKIAKEYLQLVKTIIDEIFPELDTQEGARLILAEVQQNGRRHQLWKNPKLANLYGHAIYVQNSTQLTDRVSLQRLKVTPTSLETMLKYCAEDISLHEFMEQIEEVFRNLPSRTNPETHWIDVHPYHKDEVFYEDPEDAPGGLMGYGPPTALDLNEPDDAKIYKQPKDIVKYEANLSFVNNSSSMPNDTTKSNHTRTTTRTAC